MQSKTESLIESLSNQVLGFVLAILMYHYVVPLITGIHTSSGQSTIVVLMFTTLSVCRSYAIRRIFNTRVKIK